jgi:NitT/TauT family transport system permease protein
VVTITQLLIVALVLVLWEYLPTIPALRNSGHVFNPVFVSSPSAVVRRLYEILIGQPSTRAYMWQYIWHTVGAATVGLIIGLFLGGAAGLVIGNWHFLGQVFRPLAVVVNAVPRIAVIPIIIVLLGTNFTSSIVNSVIVVFFIALFNAFEGATTVAPQFIENAEVLGASRRSVMWNVRLPFVVGWTLASLPIAATYSILAVVTGELLSGYAGLGRVIAQAQGTLDVSLTFCIVIILAVLGLVLVGAAELVKRRLLHWWGR